MKVEIDNQGRLRIVAETSVEAFAMRMWAQQATIELVGVTSDLLLGEAFVYRGSKLVVVGPMMSAAVHHSPQQGQEERCP